MIRQKDEAVSVGLLARSIISRLEASAKLLVTEIKFDCNFCNDTGFVEQGDRHKRCVCKTSTKQPDSAKFF